MTDPERNLDPPNYPEKQDSSEYLSVCCQADPEYTPDTDGISVCSWCHEQSIFINQANNTDWEQDMIDKGELK